MTVYARYLAPSSAGTVGASALRLVARAAHWLGYLHDRARERRYLAELDDRLLRDIGLSRADVAHELSKPFWRW